MSLPVDLGALGDWMDGQGLPAGEITQAKLLTGGTQNILLQFQRGGVGYVLRRPPLHKRANSDETMRREARVLGALAGSAVPHPALIAACADVAVLGAAFYLMQPIDGFNPGAGMPAPHKHDPAMRHAMGLSMVDGAAALGNVDHVTLGLADFGKESGWAARQVPRWRAQLQGYREVAGYDGTATQHVDALGDWLERHQPADSRPGIMHGDYHLANMLFSRACPKLAAIVDWELCTIGDPLLDLGWMIATWPDPETGAVPSPMPLQPADGYPAPSELIARYAERSSRSLDAMPWYQVLACYKLGIILEGSHARACAGKMRKPVGDMLHAAALALFARGQRWMQDN